ncbi:MAG TPA: prolipoprotein diacylglyceryl transferase [Candidatus Limiplasma sp.]|nr:prolipoprotein diacylglyceryl transferase [Candidatus Limiplasma sp.]
MPFEPVVLCSVFGHPVYAFGLSLALAALVCACLLHVRAGRQRLRPETTSVFVLWALVLGVALARLLYCLLRWEQIAYDWDGLFRGYGVIFAVSEGGFTVYGAFAGVALAALITARRTGQRFLQILDWAAPAGALVIALGRGAEILGGGGFGNVVPEGGPTFFPFAVYNEWLGAWSYAVFMAEAAAAALIFIVLLRLERKPHRAGDITLLFLLYYAAAQLVLERLRRDDFLAWGFVLVAQVICAALIVFVAAAEVTRSIRAGMKKGPALFDAGLTLAVIVWSGLTEYLFDKNLFGTIVIGNTTLHLLRAGLLLLAAIVLTVRLRRASGGIRAVTAAD